MYRLGIDLGGTNIVAGLVDEEYRIVAKASCKTNVPRPESDICDSMAEVAVKAVEKAGITMDEVESIGIGVPGAVNPKTGIIEYSANLFFHNWEVVRMMKERLNKKVIIENDANAAALGEYLAGSAKGAKNAVAITLGTGVGGGIIIDGKILTGAKGSGGEIGHLHLVDDEPETCGCGNHGCFEMYASATGAVRLAKRLLASTTEDSVLRGKDFECRDIFDAAKSGDALAKKAAEQYGYYLGKGIAAVASVTNPEIIVLGGGVSKAGDMLFDLLMPSFKKYVFPGCADAKFALAKLGNDAGVFGAAKLVID